MSLFAGLDVSVRTTAICVLDAMGRVLHESTADSTPEAIAGYLHSVGHRFERIGLEAGPLSQWIYAGLVDRTFRRSASKRATCMQRSRHGSIRPTATTRAGSLK